MNNVSILMFIFGIAILITGAYMFKGHKIDGLAWRAPYKGLNEDGWKNIGKWTMIVSVIPFIIAIVCLFF